MEELRQTIKKAFLKADHKFLETYAKDKESMKTALLLALDEAENEEDYFNIVEAVRNLSKPKIEQDQNYVIKRKAPQAPYLVDYLRELMSHEDPKIRERAKRVFNELVNRAIF